jgi:conjugal transfer pilus assembly protein TraB
VKLDEWVKQNSPKIFLGIVIVGVLGIGYLFVSQRQPAKTPPSESSRERPVVNLLPSNDLDREHWRITAEQELLELKTKLQEITQKVEELSKPGKEPPARTVPLIPFPPQALPPAGGVPPAPPPPAKGPANLPSLSPIPPPIHVFGPEARIPSGEGNLPGTGKIVPASAGSREGTQKPYLPSGSFVKGILLSGLDAPAGARASQEPHPVLIRLEDKAILPNRFRFDVKECFIIGEGYGDLSSERAYIRTTALSCVRPDGTSVDAPLKGFVAGEDGKVGLRGRVVSKQGQLLAKALVAGFAEGMAKVFSVSMTTVSVSPLGSTQTIEPEKAFRAGLLGGASEALERLAHYYIDMAERLFPVIEIDAGRSVDVVVLQGKTLAPVE